MLQRVLTFSICLAAAGAIPVSAHAAQRGEAKCTMGGKAVSIEYGRPSLEGRDMLARATPGEPWRMGADAATTLTTEADLSFGAVAVPKGSYVLTATKDDKQNWTLNVHARDRSKKVADVPLTASKLEESVETFTIELRGEKNKGEFEMKWGTTALKAGFSAK